jgi:hypothetical protein
MCRSNPSHKPDSVIRVGDAVQGGVKHLDGTRGDVALRGLKPGLRTSAFTVTELLVAVSLMTLIVLALYSMFNQTQKAMRANENQVDSTERGRGVLDIVSREIESARPGLRSDAVNLWIRQKNITPLVQNDFTTGNAASRAPLRTNVFDDVYYLAKYDKAWRGVGYVVLQATNLNPTAKTLDVLTPPDLGMGTLYRYETLVTNRDYAFPSTNLFRNFLAIVPTNNVPATWPVVTNFSQVSDGVVHFKVLPYDSSGQLMAFGTTNIDSNYRLMRRGIGNVFIAPGSNIEQNLANYANVVLEQGNSADPLNTVASFYTNALPAYVELELGVLEPDSLRTYRQMLKDEAPATKVQEFLKTRVTKVQIYRKRIPFRTVAQ